MMTPSQCSGSPSGRGASPRPWLPSLRAARRGEFRQGHHPRDSEPGAGNKRFIRDLRPLLCAGFCAGGRASLGPPTEPRPETGP